MKTRNTIQKNLIKNTVLNLKNHPSAEEIYSEIIKTNPSVSKGTVYRNLGILADNGEILRIEMPNSPDRFDFRLEKHYHIQCDNCGKVFDLDVPCIEELEHIKDKEFLVTGYQLVFKGICKECKEG
ncbi:Fur family transcriptional regulator [Aminipila sp.]|uniref:Fur family transcriptional regulator n=1 Tax=Aminipila sp. TaxID=2060095 RepID=UPI001D8A1117|nr:transcriptional repressor [Aminipila sp.]MBE6034310.1 transcriptional repressor [Clostridiales bacterium]